LKTAFFHKLKLIIFYLSFLISCSSPVDIDNFDKDKWSGDEYGCRGVRKHMVDNLLEQKNELEGLTQTEILAVLGKPDRHELYKRNQKFFIYNLSPGEKCDEGSSKPSVLQIRFNALGNANEIIVEN